MRKSVLFTSLDGLFAYDTGATDSGIKDDVLKNTIKEHLDSLSSEEFRLLITEYIRENFVSENAVEKGYGIEDVSIFINWLSDQMNLDI